MTPVGLVPTSLIHAKPIPENCWIEHPVAVRVLEHLLHLVDHANHFRPQGCLVIGDPDNGKTFLLRRFAALVAEHSESLEDEDAMPALYFQAPVGAIRRDFHQALASLLRIPVPHRPSGPRLRIAILQALSDRKVRVLLVDELHHLVSGGDGRVRIVIDDLKYWSNQLGIPIVAAGTDRAYNAIRSDDQYLSRIPPLKLPRWTFDREYLGLLAALEEEMEVPPASYTSRKTSELIWTHSRGLIGRTVRILNDALRLAQKEGAEGINEAHVNKAGFSELPWLDPEVLR